ncbi:hypothetical protein ABZS71_07590 [Streptomyces sp. NPDC005393]|uniref:hypothetical protein n=1 Tax=Streptomyces sp. NPDC005393 TaxID=3157041 RepID=UPI0033A1589E
MTAEYAWRGRAEDGEDHLTLTAAEDAIVRGAWERAAAKRADFDDMMRDIQGKTAEHGGQLPGDRMESEGVHEIDYSLTHSRRAAGSHKREGQMSTTPQNITYTEDGAPRFTGIVHWRHAAGPAHCLVRAAYIPETHQATVLVSEIASNPDNRGITADFGKVADAILPLLQEAFRSQLQRAVWIAHFGEFSYHDPAGPDTFTQVPLVWQGDTFVDDRKGDVRISRADTERFLGGWQLRPVPEVLSELGHEG